MSNVATGAPGVVAGAEEEAAVVRSEAATAPRGRVERYLPLVTGAIVALPTLLAYYPPMSDLPLHEGVVGILRHFGDAEYFPKPIYELNLGHSNQIFHLTSWLLSLIVGTRWAVKIVIAISQIAIFATGARFCDHLGRSRWATLLLTPLALGFTYHWGLVANLIGYSTYLFALPFLDGFAERPRPKDIPRCVGLFALLFFAHESSYVMAIGALVLFSFARPASRRELLPRLAPAILASVAFVVHLYWTKQLMPKGQLTYGATWFTLRQKTSLIPNVLFGSHSWEARLMLFVLGSAAFGTLLAARAKGDPGDWPRRPRSLEAVRELLLRYRFEALALSYLALYFTLPFNWNGVTLLHDRFLGPAWSLLALSAAPRAAPRLVSKVSVAFVPLGILLVEWPQFEDSSRTFRDLDAAMAVIPRGSATALCVLDRPGAGQVRAYSAGPGPARVVAERGGRAALSLVISPLSPVLIKPGYRWDDIDVRLFADASGSLLPDHDVGRWQYVIGESRDRGIRQAIVLAFEGSAELVFAKGEWLVLRARKPPVPLDAPDDPAPKRRLETVRERVTAIEKAYLDAARGGPPLPPPPDIP